MQPLVPATVQASDRSVPTTIQSDAYFEVVYCLMLWDFLFGLLLAWALLGWRFSARMRDFATSLTRFRWAQTAFYVIEYYILRTLLVIGVEAYDLYISSRRRHT